MFILCCRAVHRYSCRHNLLRCNSTRRLRARPSVVLLVSIGCDATYPLVASRCSLSARTHERKPYGGYFLGFGGSARQPERVMVGNLAGPGAAQKKWLRAQIAYQEKSALRASECSDYLNGCIP